MATLSERGYDSSWLKQTYLLGVDLTLDDGSDYPDEIFKTSLEQAERAVADELGLVFDPQTFRERHDKEPDGASSWYPIRSRYRPLVSVDALNIVYGQSSTKASLPKNWAMITESIAGQVHIVPTTEGASSYLIAGGMPVILGLGGLNQPFYLPAYFELEYLAGFPLYSGSSTISAGETVVQIATPQTFLDPYSPVISDPIISVISKTPDHFSVKIASPLGVDTPVSWKIDTLPRDIARAVALKASLLALDVAGDLIAGAGIAMVSTSMDGLSQNINTTASATNSGYGARVLQFTKEYKELISTLRATYRAMNIMAL
jgi:hypothetical protein